MVVDERSRHGLFQQLERALGEEAAATLMEHLPPTGWADVATRRDLDAQGNELRNAIAAQGNELRNAIDTLRSEMRSGFELAHRDLAVQSSELRGEMASLRADVRGELTSAVTAQTRTIMFSMLGAILAHGGLVLAVVRLS